MKNNYIQIFTTTDKKEIADKIALSLVEKKLAQCVQIFGPVESTYRWKGRIERTSEWLCIIKTKKANYKKIENEIKKIHTYEVPEIIAIPIITGSNEYLKWLAGKEIF